MNGSLQRLRPMTVGDLLDETFALYRRNFALFAGIVAVLTIPQTILIAILTSRATTTIALRAGRTAEVDWDAFSATLGILGLTFLLGLVFSQLITGPLAYAISERYLGHPITVGQAYASIGVATFVRLIIVALVQAVVLVFGFILLVIPGIYLLVRFAFLSQTVVLEQAGVGRAFSRSWHLVGGSWWRVFGIGLLVIVLVGIVQGIIGGVITAVLLIGQSSGTVSTLLNQAVSTVISIVVQPVQLTALTLLYYDLRIRKEGFDIELAAQSLDNPQPV